MKSKNNHFSEEVSVFRDRVVPEDGFCAGYFAIIKFYGLEVPLPDRFCAISKRFKKYETDEWLIFEPKYMPEDSLAGNLVFAFKYEGIDLGVLSSLFKVVSGDEIKSIVLNEPYGKYARKLWFLYEWLTGVNLDIGDLKKGNFENLIDERLQSPGVTVKSSRHRINNNLPGVRNFCPLIRKTKKLEGFINSGLRSKLYDDVFLPNFELISRAASFLLLKDTKASFLIEGEKPLQNRVLRWGRALALAGKNEINKNELLRLQSIVIGDSGFTKLGFRTEGGFVGVHERSTGEPIPDHISARVQDVDLLLNGLIDTYNKLKGSDFDAVLLSAIVSFGFVFIHPFVDGNGRIHRFLINDVLVRKNFTKDSYVFPISTVFLERISEYRKTLELFSFPRLVFIEWKPTSGNNVEVLNDTIDLYRYFDATKQAEFLYDCVKYTIEDIIPKEIVYLKRFDYMKRFLNERFDLSDTLINMIIRFLEQGEGKFSKRAREKELAMFSDEELNEIVIKNGEMSEEA